MRPTVCGRWALGGGGERLTQEMSARSTEGGNGVRACLERLLSMACEACSISLLPHSLCSATPALLLFLQFLACSCFKVLYFIVPSAGKALSPDMLRAYPPAPTPFTSLYGYYLTRDLSCLKWSLCFPSCFVFLYSPCHHLTLIIDLFIVCLSHQNVNTTRISTLFSSLLNVQRLEQCLASARYAVKLLNEEGAGAF